MPPLFRGRPVFELEENARPAARPAPISARPRRSGSPPTAAARSGRCIFCGDCATACPEDVIRFTADWRLAASERTELIGGTPTAACRGAAPRAASSADASLRLRQISAGGCNGCEVEVNALGNVVFDASRFGMTCGVAASRRRRLITGPIIENMRAATLATYEAVAELKLASPLARARYRAIYRQHPEVCERIEGLFPVDLYIPGCPPHPVTILDGLLRLLGRL